MSKRIIFVGGGTSGHIAPLLAVIEAVQKLDPEVWCGYVGLNTDLDSPLIKSTKLSFERFSIQSGKLHRFLTIDNFSQPFRVVKGYFQAHKLLTTLKPDLILAKGGFVCVPMVLAAVQLKIPIFTHESDAVPGLANRFIARYACRIFTAFDANYYTEYLPAQKLITSGQPVRPAFREPVKLPIMLDGREIPLDLPLITVIGGSQGAKRLNALTQELWPELLTRMRVVHITGRAQHHELMQAKQKLPAKLEANLWLSAFVQDELPALFQKSTIVISRAGGTIAELAAAGSTAILVPLSTSSQGHQQKNAAVMTNSGAVIAFDEVNGDSLDLAMIVRDLVNDDDLRRALKRQIRKFDHPDAAQTMAKELLKAI